MAIPRGKSYELRVMSYGFEIVSSTDRERWICRGESGGGSRVDRSSEEAVHEFDGLAHCNRVSNAEALGCHSAGRGYAQFGPVSKP